MKTDINPKEQDPWQEEMTHLCEKNPGGRVIQTEPTGRVRASSGSGDRRRKWSPEHLRQQEEHARPEEPGTGGIGEAGGRVTRRQEIKMRTSSKVGHNCTECYGCVKIFG